MTARKHLKQLVRERMRKTGERYTVARRHVVERRHVVGAPRRRSRRHRRVRERARQPRRRRTAHRRAADRGDGARRRRRARRGLHPVGVRARTATRACSRSASGASGSTRTAGRAGPPSGSACTPSCTRPAARRARAAALDAQLDRGLPAIVWIDTVHARAPERARVARRLRRPAAVVYGRDGDALRDRRPLGGARSGARAERLAAARARVGSYKHRLITIDPGAGRAATCARGRRGRAAAPGRAPEREVGLVLAAGVAQVGADDHRHAQQEGLADRVRRRARRSAACARRSTPAPPHGAPPARASTPTSSTRRAALLGRDALRDAATAWREAASRGTRSSMPRCRRGDELRELIDGDDRGGALGRSSAPRRGRRGAARRRRAGDGDVRGRDRRARAPQLGRRVTESYLIVPLVSRQVSGVRPVREVPKRSRASLPAVIR